MFGCLHLHNRRQQMWVNKRKTVEEKVHFDSMNHSAAANQTNSYSILKKKKCISPHCETAHEAINPAVNPLPSHI